MSTLLHFIGLCPDALSHIDLLDLFVMCGFSVSLFVYWLRFWITGNPDHKPYQEGDTS